MPRKQRSLVILMVMTAACMACAQVQDNFSDGDFTSNPVWAGNDAKFIVSTGLLKLQAPVVAETAYLSTSCNAIHNASWEFYVQLDFNPSSANFTRVYLVSDQPDLNQPLKGYYVMVGNTADEISLYRQTGSTLTKIIDGLDGRVNLTTVSVKVKITRDASANWQLFSDVGATGTYNLEGTIIDQTHTKSTYLGVHCTYTSTRSDKFWFDDFVVTGTPVPDLTPPVLTTVEVLNQNTIIATFSEVVDPSSAQISANYTVNNNIGNPLLAVLQPNAKSVLVTLSNPLINGLIYALQVSGIQDLDGNVMTFGSVDFLYFVPKPVNSKDIIVSEFMADPSPVVGLPESEFVELFNRSANPVDLQGWKLSDGTTVTTLPQFILMPALRCLVVPTSSIGLFTGAIGVSNFPSLNNSGDNIILKNETGILIDSVTYSMTWYRSDEKKDGGWSLEIIDPENLCEEEGNWTASENSKGGTPASQNSVFASNPDVAAPIIKSSVIVAPTILEVTFDEKLDGNGQIIAASIPEINFTSIAYSQSLRKILLTSSNPFQTSTIYSITISNIFDCAGNALVSNTVLFVLPEAAAQKDILLNEVLFNPKTGGVDFVEVFNRSNKHISLKKWSLANNEDGLVSNPKIIETQNLVMPPKSFLVFTTEPSILKAHYPRTIASVCLPNTLPSLPDGDGSIALVDSLGMVMDYFLYSDNYHVVFLKDKEGVSLERVSLLSETNDINNWRSASQAENFATPGYKNSSSAEGSSNTNGDVLVEPEMFSPQIAPNDFTKINYRFDQSGQVANASIFDQQGHLIKTLANNEVLGTEGFFRWDGDRDDGGRARAGYYIVWVEVFRVNGEINTFRKRIVVAFR